jgi:hypothetical protein
MSWVASSDQRRSRAPFVATLLVITALGGCGGGEGDSTAEQKPAGTRVGGGKIQADRLDESVAKKKAAPNPGQ